MPSEGRPVTVQVQSELAEDLLSPARVGGDHRAIAFLRYVQKKNNRDGYAYLSQVGIIYATALAVAGYVTLEYRGATGPPRCSLTEAGTALLQLMDT